MHYCKYGFFDKNAPCVIFKNLFVVFLFFPQLPVHIYCICLRL